MEVKAGWLDFADFAGGLNDTAPPSRIRDNQLTIADNIDFQSTPVMQRRRGYASSGTTWSMSSASPVKLCALIRHTPTVNPRNAELFGIDDSNGGGNPAAPVFGRLAAGTAFAAVTISDNLTPVTDAVEVYGASLRGKLYLAYNSAVDRLHVYDPDSGTIRRVGFATPGAPSCFNFGAGAYPAIIRYYKTRWVDVVSGTGTRLSEWSSATAFTPSGLGTAAQVFRAALAGEGEDSWQLAASADNINFYILATIAAATTFYDDTAAVSSYSSNPRATAADTFTTPGSARYVLADINRLLTSGSWEVPALANSRVFFSHPIGAITTGYDEEYFPSNNFLDLESTSGGGITGMVALAGVPHVFKLTHIWQLVRTGNAAAPYQPVNLSRVVGALRGKAIVEGEDAHGVPCLYFLSTRGPYRLIAGQPQYLGRDIETIWSTVNLAENIPHHGVWYADNGQVRFYVAVDSATLPNRCLVFHVEQGGWTVERYGSGLSTTRDLACSCMFSRVPGAAMSIDLKPWVSRNVLCEIADVVGQEADNAFGTFRAYARTKALAPFGEGKKFRLTQLHQIATVGKTYTASLIRDFGNLTHTKTLTMAAAVLTEDRATKRYDDLEISECQHVQIEVGDGAATTTTWAIDLLRAEVAQEQTSHT